MLIERRWCRLRKPPKQHARLPPTSTRASRRTPALRKHSRGTAAGHGHTARGSVWTIPWRSATSGCSLHPSQKGIEVRELVERLRKFRDDRDWDRFHAPKDLAVSVCVEAGELLELFQWRPDGSPLDESLTERIGDDDDSLKARHCSDGQAAPETSSICHRRAACVPRHSRGAPRATFCSYRIVSCRPRPTPKEARHCPVERVDPVRS